jgi:signal transduction histidine kinase
MIHKPDSHDPVAKIIRLIQTHRNAQAMLSEIATAIGECFSVDVCVIVAGTSVMQKLVTGLWKKNEMTEISENIKIIPQLFAHPLIKCLLAQEQLLVIATEITSNSSSQVKTLTDLLSVQALIGISTAFHGDINGLILLGVTQAYQLSETAKEHLKLTAQAVAIACSIAGQEAMQESFSEETSLSLSLFTGSRLLTGESNPLIRQWYKMTRQQLEQQRHLNELKDDIITTISHEAGTPLATMKLAIQMLNNNPNLSKDTAQRYLNILQQEWQRLNDLISNIKTLQKLESEKVTSNPQWVDVKFILEELRQYFQDQWQQDRRKQLSLEIEIIPLKESENNPLTIYTDAQHLKSILSEILTNAGKFATANTTVFLQVSEQQIDGHDNLIITITNQGLGISEQAKEHIFEPFSRGQGMTEKAIPGTGLGLALVRGLVALLGGKIDCASDPTDEPDSFMTSFILSLPRISVVNSNAS